MTDPRFVGLPVASTPVEARDAGARPRALPRDVLQGAGRRLQLMGLVAAVLWFLGNLLAHVAMRPGHPDRWRLWPTDIVAVVAIAASLGVWYFARRSHARPEVLLDIGLAYMVLTAFELGVVIHWAPMPEHAITPTLTWVGPVLLMTAAIIPNSPMRTFVAGMIAASMAPVSMLIARARGTWPFEHATDVLVMHYPDYLLVGVAVVISHVVTRLGQQVGRAREMGSYQLGERIGAGGMGDVYRASHRMLARPAAIKLIRPESLGAADSGSARLAVARFRREAEAAANLRSPHTLELYDFGVTEDGTFYLVMELLDGMDLEAMVREYGRLPVGRAVWILAQVCDSLEEAHESGLLHRDIKPANIHVGRVGRRHDFVKVLDFGLVKSMRGEGADTNATLATAEGLTPGTPAYMAPEMALGEAVDARADIYAVGCVAYYLLTGKMVFEAPNHMQMVMKHMQEPPVSPSARAGVRFPPGLDDLVLSCLAKAPDQRPSSAAELRRCLELIARDPWSEEMARQWWTDRRKA